MRANTKIIMIIVIVGFVGMIVFGWGMDITDRGSGSQAGIIGKINGEKITYEVYNSYIQTRRESLGDRQAVKECRRRTHCHQHIHIGTLVAKSL